MIECQLRHLEQRCQQRGYTLEQVAACIVSRDGDRIVVDQTHPAYPRKPPAPPREPKPRPVTPPPRQLPPLAERVKNFAKSAVKHVAAGARQCTQEEIDARYAICQACEFFTNGSCGKCGCPLAREKKFISKLAWASESCPVGKWGPVQQPPPT